MNCDGCPAIAFYQRYHFGMFPDIRLMAAFRSHYILRVGRKKQTIGAPLAICPDSVEAVFWHLSYQYPLASLNIKSYSSQGWLKDMGKQTALICDNITAILQSTQSESAVYSIELYYPSSNKSAFFWCKEVREYHHFLEMKIIRHNSIQNIILCQYLTQFTQLSALWTT